MHFPSNMHWISVNILGTYLVLKKEFKADELLNLGRYQKDNNIKPGTEAWFKLWFARQYITGETPHDKI